MPVPQSLTTPTITVTSPQSGSNINPTVVAFGKCTGMTANSIISCTLTQAGTGTSTVTGATLYSSNSKWKVSINSGLANGTVVNLAISSTGATTVNVNNLTIDTNTPVATPPA